MHEAVKWSGAEQKIARRAFDAALQRELDYVMADFKARAQRAKSPQDMWDVADFLREEQRRINLKYDFRYSRLLGVFGVLLREKRIIEDDLLGLSEQKLESVRTVAAL